jgi:hypothetical protein
MRLGGARVGREVRLPSQRRARQDENKRTAARRRLHMEGLRREPVKGAGKGGITHGTKGGVNRVLHTLHPLHPFLRKRGREE